MTQFRKFLALLLGAVIVAPTLLRAQTPSTVVILVRHAEKADEPGGDPGLSAAGELRARALADTLCDAKLAAVFTTPFRRTQLTAAPLVAASGLTPIIVPVNGGPAAYAKLVQYMITNQFIGRTVLVVGHANTIPAVITALGGPTVSDLCENEYATMYVLTMLNEGQTKLDVRHYGAGDAECAGSMAKPSTQH